MGAAGRTKAVERYDIRRQAAAIKSVYAACLNGS
jgi:hypothetical protein